MTVSPVKTKMHTALAKQILDKYHLICSFGLFVDFGRTIIKYTVNPFQMYRSTSTIHIYFHQLYTLIISNIV